MMLSVSCYCHGPVHRHAWELHTINVWRLDSGADEPITLEDTSEAMPLVLEAALLSWLSRMANL